MKHGHIEKLIATDYTLFTLETPSPGKIVNSFRYFSRTGLATYVWDDALGLSRLEASHISLPNTDSPAQVLNHILSSRHYGIYLLQEFNQFIQDDELQSMLQQLSSTSTDQKIKSAKKTVIFLDHKFELPEKLLNHILMAQAPANSENA